MVEVQILVDDSLSLQVLGRVPFFIEFELQAQVSHDRVSLGQAETSFGVLHRWDFLEGINFSVFRSSILSYEECTCPLKRRVFTT